MANDQGDPSRAVRRTWSLLDGVNPRDYYGAPSAVDESIAGLLAALGEAPSNDWDVFVGSMITQRRHVLGRYSLRAPMLALRTGERRHLYAGLLAQCAYERIVIDPRDDMVGFAPYVHVARTMGVDVTELFDGVARFAVEDLATLMRQFGRRTDVTLEAFGWRQIDTPDAPTIEALDWKGSPSGAVVGEPSWDRAQEAQIQRLREWLGKDHES